MQAISTEKAKLYRTARATIGCANVDAGEYVSVHWYWQDEKGTNWYVINAGRGDVAYPEHHLSNFVL